MQGYERERIMAKKNNRQTVRTRNASGKPRTRKKIVLFGKVLFEKKLDRQKLHMALGALLIVFVLLLLVLLNHCGLFSRNVPPADTGDLRVHFVDVGQGDCAMIELPDGKIVVIDGGDAKQKDAVDGYARQLGIDKIDYLIISHGDADHFAGLTTLLGRVEIGTAYLPYEGAAVGTAYGAVRSLVCGKAESVEESRRYDTISGEGYVMTFLYPYSGELMERMYPNLKPNNTSAVVWLDYYGSSVLFCGDIETKVEKILTSEWETDPFVFESKGVYLDSTEILKVAHHGSKTSSDRAWLELLNYETAVISCGADNSYGHPNGEVVERLTSVGNGAKIYRTDECGSVTVTMHTDGTYGVSYENSTGTDETVRSIAFSEWAGSLYIFKNRYAEDRI